MEMKVFNRISKAVIIFIFGFSSGVAIASWKWFPEEDDWSHIAEIPQNALNYFALLAPFVVLLLYVVIRRIYYKQPL